MQTWSAKRIKEAIAKERLGTGSYSDVLNFKAAHGSQPQCGVPPGHGTCPVGDMPPGSDVLRSHLYNLRKKVDKPFDHTLIHTVHGVGFQLKE